MFRFFSFNGNKTVTCGGGGCVVSNDEQLAKKIRHLSTTAKIDGKYNHDLVGFNYRLTNIQGAVGCAQMEQLETFVAKKRAIYSKYQRELQEIDSINFLYFPEAINSSCWLSFLVLDKSINIKEVITYLNKKGVEVRQFWKPIHLQIPYKNSIRTSMTFCEDIYERILLIPCSTSLSCEQQDYVIKLLKEIF